MLFSQKSTILAENSQNMAELSLANTVYSPEDYFDIDQQSKDRYEYENGYIWAMAGTTINHNRIVLNTAFIIRSIIKQNKRKCDIFAENIRLEVAKKSVYYYPDLIFTCNPLDLQEKITLHNPSLIVEVLSDSSFVIDLNHKLDNYLKMPSLLYYMVITQDDYKVRLWEKKGEDWIYTAYSDLAEIVNLSQIDLSLPLADIYENVIFQVNG